MKLVESTDGSVEDVMSELRCRVCGGTVGPQLGALVIQHDKNPRQPLQGFIPSYRVRRCNQCGVLFAEDVGAS